MSAEDYEIFDILKKESQEEAEKRRAIGHDDFYIAQQIAISNNMFLKRHTSVHYTLKHNDGWAIQLYPGNQRVYRDKNQGTIKAPFLKLPFVWSLIDVVKAAKENNEQNRKS